MKNIWKNSIVIILFIAFFIFKDNIYFFTNNKEYNFNYLKENELKYYKKEYEDLSGIKNDNNYLLSKIIYRNIYDFYNKILITKGRDYNLKKGDIVVSEDSFIGIIDKVNKNTSTVNLLYNKNLKVSVKVNDTYGILESKNDKLYVKNIVSDSNINVGDIVYTSGLTDIIGDIPIGEVLNIKTTDDKLEKILEIRELTNLKKLKYVMIVHKESDET